MRESARREPPIIGDPDLDIFIPSLGREVGRVRIIPSGDPGRSDRPGSASSDTSMDRGGVAMNQVEIEQSGEPCLWEMSYEGTPECKHPLPVDWDFGVDPLSREVGDPRTDPRWQPETFIYLDQFLRRITITQVPRCMHEAIGSHKDLVEKQTGRKVYYITGGLPDTKAETIYSDADGALSVGD